MAQIFHRSMNTLARLSILGGAFTAAGFVGLVYLYNQSPLQTNVGLVRDQPVPFSHEHHVRGLGIDCRYCHTTVETTAISGVPPTYTCMSCHSQIWTGSPMLQPVRTSLAEDKPLRWSKLHDLPDFVYFHHGIHVQKGIGCVECHGRIDEMPLAFKAKPLTMEWCLDCHREPEKHIRPKEQVVNMDWKAEDEKGVDGKPMTQRELGTKLVHDYHIPVDRLTNCSTCHR